MSSGTCFGGKTEASSLPFSDVNENDWFYPYVDMLVGEGVLNGMTPTTYEPYGTLTSAQLCALISRYLGLSQLAQTQRDYLLSCEALGAGCWFSGYIDVLYKCGVISLDDFSLEIRNGILHINEEAEYKLNLPIKRSSASKMIALSFELDDSSDIKAQNMYPEISSLGHDFIVGGGYDEESLSLYKNDIADYNLIDKDLQIYVDKCYYNGIFNGDDNHNFNPNNSLTRAEAAKIISVITHFNMRERNEYRDLPPTAIVTDNDYYTDIDGIRRLTSAKICDILWQESNSFKIYDNKFVMTLNNIIPSGYTIEIALSRLDSSRYVTLHKQSLSTIGSYNLPCTFEVSTEYNSLPCELSVLLYMRNIALNGQIEGIAEYKVGTDGKVHSSVYEV